MCARNKRKASPPRSAQSSGRFSPAVRRGASTGTEAIIRTTSSQTTKSGQKMFRGKPVVVVDSKLGHYEIQLLQNQSISTAGPVEVAPTSASRAVTALAMRYKLCAAGAD